MQPGRQSVTAVPESVRNKTLLKRTLLLAMTFFLIAAPVLDLQNISGIMAELLMR